MQRTARPLRSLFYDHFHTATASDAPPRPPSLILCLVTRRRLCPETSVELSATQVPASSLSINLLRAALRPQNVFGKVCLLLIGSLGGTEQIIVKKKLHILAVDDEPIIGESISYVLEAPHRKIAVAKDGQEALAMAAKENFDVIITDHRMPRSGGLELVRKLRQRKYTGKIVVLSAYLSEEHIGDYEELAVDEIVGKPFDSAELREVIAGLEEDI